MENKIFAIGTRNINGNELCNCSQFANFNNISSQLMTAELLFLYKRQMTPTLAVKLMFICMVFCVYQKRNNCKP